MMGLLWPLINFVTGALFLGLVVLSIPLAFDLGGQDCGLTFSLLLASFYFVQSTFRIIVLRTSSGTAGRVLVRLGSFLQYFIVPALLIYSLHKFSPEDDAGARGFLGKLTQTNRNARTWEQSVTIGPWETFLTFSTPVFQLCEGFCSLLVIQACGQVARWLVNKNRSDGWMIALLIMSGSTISSAAYFLWRITTFSTISNIDSTLIGVVVTCAIFLCGYGIASGRGNPVESSLMFAYVTLSLYQIFTDYKPNHPPPVGTPQTKPELPPFPPIIMESYATVVSSLASSVPITVGQGFRFVSAVVSTITPSVLISLAYRLFVFYGATRIIPAVRESGARGLEKSPSLDDEEVSSRIVGLFTEYSPSILVAIYTHLLMQHFAMMDFSTTSVGSWVFQTPVGGQIWRWVNIIGTMALYYFELLLGEENPESLTSHWKTD